MTNIDKPRRRRGLRLSRARTAYLLRVGLLVAALAFVAWVYGGDVYVVLALGVCAVGLFARGIAPGLIPELVWIMVRVPFALGVFIPAWRALEALFQADGEGLTWAGTTVLVYGLAVWTLVRLPLGMRRPFLKWLPDGALSPQEQAAARAGEVGTTRGYRPAGTAGAGVYGRSAGGSAYGTTSSRYGSYGASSVREEPAQEAARGAEKKRRGLFGRGKPDEAPAMSPAASTSGPFTTSAPSTSPASRYGATSSRYGTSSSRYGAPSGREADEDSAPSTSPASRYGATSSRYGTSSSRYGAPSGREADEDSAPSTSPASRYGATSSRYGPSAGGQPAQQEKKGRRGLLGRGKKEEAASVSPASRYGATSSRYGPPAGGRPAQQEKKGRRGLLGRGLLGRGKKEEAASVSPANRYGVSGRQGPFTFQEPEAAEPTAAESDQKRAGRFRRGKKAKDAPAASEAIPLPPPASGPFKTGGGYQGFLAALDEMAADDDRTSTAHVNPFTTGGASGFLSALDPSDEDSPENEELRRMHEARMARLKRLEEMKAKIDKKFTDE